MKDLKFKLLTENAVLPKYAKVGDAGLDLTATSVEVDGGVWTYRTGIAVEIPEGHVGLLFPRSSIYKTSHRLTNSVGVIDSGYRGEIMFKFKTDSVGEIYEVGDRVGQLVIIEYPQFNPVAVDELSETERGAGGYGSSGK